MNFQDAMLAKIRGEPYYPECAICKEDAPYEIIGKDGFGEKYVLFYVCGECLLNRSGEVASKARKSRNNAIAPHGYYKGKPIHKLSKEEMLEVIVYLQNRVHYSNLGY